MCSMHVELAESPVNAGHLVRTVSLCLYIKLGGLVCSHCNRASPALQITTSATGLLHGHNADH